MTGCFLLSIHYRYLILHECVCASSRYPDSHLNNNNINIIRRKWQTRSAGCEYIVLYGEKFFYTKFTNNTDRLRYYY